MRTVTVDKLTFKKELSMIEQFSIKDFLYRWLGEPREGIDLFLPLDYTTSVFAKLEAKEENALLINKDETFRYATLSETNQMVIGVLDSNRELQHLIVSLDDVLVRN